MNPARQDGPCLSTWRGGGIQWSLTRAGFFSCCSDSSTQAPTVPQESRHHRSFWKDQILPAGADWWERPGNGKSARVTETVSHPCLRTRRDRRMSLGTAGCRCLFREGTWAEGTKAGVTCFKLTKTVSSDTESAKMASERRRGHRTSPSPWLLELCLQFAVASSQ